MALSNSPDDVRSRAAQSHAQPPGGEHGEHGGRSARTLDGAATPKLPAPEGQGRNAPAPLPCGERGSARGKPSPQAAHRAANRPVRGSDRLCSPHPLTGGSGHTGGSRPLPNVIAPPLASWGAKAALLAAGLDTVVEAFDLSISDSMCERLEAARLRAEALSEELTGRELISLGGVQLQMIALRGRGLRWRLENDDITIRIRPVKMGFPVSVRYSAAGLWEHGYPKLRETAEKALRALGTPRRPDWERLSELHHALDFHAPNFTPEMRPRLLEQVIAHSEVKCSAICGRDRQTDEAWGKAGRMETLTIGKGAPLEIQVYDKGREIDEVSGKTWMLDLWELSGAWSRSGRGRQEHCWRIEVRFRADFLRDRSILSMDDYTSNASALLSEALLTRRLCHPTTDSNRARWPLHWLWAAALHHARRTDHALPLGRRLTEARSVLADRINKNLAGTLRSAVVLRRGRWDRATAYLFLPRLIELAEADDDHEHKVALARERYRYLDEAR